MIKDAANTFKRQTGRKMFAAHITAKGPISLKGKGLLGNKKKKMNHPTDKWTKDLNRAFGRERHLGGP